MCGQDEKHCNSFTIEDDTGEIVVFVIAGSRRSTNDRVRGGACADDDLQPSTRAILSVALSGYRIRAMTGLALSTTTASRFPFPMLTSLRSSGSKGGRYRADVRTLARSSSPTATSKYCQTRRQTECVNLTASSGANAAKMCVESSFVQRSALVVKSSSMC